MPLSVTRTYVKSVDVGAFPQARRAFQVTRCNQCADAPCVAACPTSAMFVRPDGIVDFDKQACIGCKACMAACPYDAIFINPEDHCAEKCNFCAHRLDVGPGAGLRRGLPDPGDHRRRPRTTRNPRRRVSSRREPVAVRRPEKGTRPKLFYRGAPPRRPSTRWPPGARPAARSRGARSSDRARAGRLRPSGRRATAARPRCSSYDVGAPGAVGLAGQPLHLDQGHRRGRLPRGLLLALTGFLPWTDTLWIWAAPLIAVVLLAVTAAAAGLGPGASGPVLLHPDPAAVALLAGARRGHPRRVRGRAGPAPAGRSGRRRRAARGSRRCRACRWPRSPRSTPLTCSRRPRPVTCGRTRCCPRTCWCRRAWPGRRCCCRSRPGTPGRGGHAARLDAGRGLPGALLLVLGELSLPHPTAHARLAARAMTPGRYRGFFWAGPRTGRPRAWPPRGGRLGRAAGAGRARSRTSTRTCRPASPCHWPRRTG